MKAAGKICGVSSSWMGGVLCLCLWAGCASSSTPNRKVYDRYAGLVAARNRSAQSLTTPQAGGSVALAPASRLVDTPAAAPVAKPDPLQAPPVLVIAPKPVEKVEPKPAAVLALVPPAPVQPASAVPAPTPAPVAALAPVEPSSTDGVAYLLKVGDVVQVFLRGIPMSDQIEDVIDEDGTVSLPLINEVQAAGMTASELERNIRKIYLDQDIYRNITVNVVVPTRFYFVQGEIRAPGRFQIMSATRVSQAIAGAGGYTEYANGQVLIKRGGKIVKTIKNSRRLERTPGDDILLEPDDIIEVKRSLW